MMTAILRLAFAAAAALSLSGIPIYPGATLDAERMKDVAAQKLNHSAAAYYTSDSFEKVVAFYKSQKGAKLQPSFGGDDNKNSKMAMVIIDEGMVGVKWPVNVRNKDGKYVTMTGISIEK
jgi:hypothetical protein